MFMLRQSSEYWVQRGWLAEITPTGACMQMSPRVSATNTSLHGWAFCGLCQSKRFGDWLLQVFLSATVQSKFQNSASNIFFLAHKYLEVSLFILRRNVFPFFLLIHAGRITLASIPTTHHLQIASLVWRCLSGWAPTYLRELLIRRPSCTPSSVHANLVIPFSHSAAYPCISVLFMWLVQKRGMDFQ